MPSRIKVGATFGGKCPAVKAATLQATEIRTMTYPFIMGVSPNCICIKIGPYVLIAMDPMGASSATSMPKPVGVAVNMDDGNILLEAFLSLHIM